MISGRPRIIITPGFSFIPRTLLGIGIEGSTGFGNLDTLPASNDTLGFASTIEGMEQYDVNAKGFIGFSDISTIQDNIQHAAGIVFFPVLKTMMDIRIPLSMGISFNLNTIAGNP